MRTLDLNDVKMYEFEILVVFDDVCKKMNINYSLSGGTLLGAVRHKGFIPWDDDIDVMMTRENYELFCKNCSKYLPKGYFMQTFDSDKNYPLNFGKLRNTSINITVKEVENLDIVMGACIDIFPVDKCPNNLFIDNLSKIIITMISFLKNCVLDERTNKNLIRYSIRKILKPIVTTIGTQKLARLENKVRANIGKNGKYTYCDDLIRPAIKIKRKDRLNWSIFDKYQYLTFENKKFSVISNYDDYLTRWYGDYMQLPPLSEQKPDHNFYIKD